MPGTDVLSMVVLVGGTRLTPVFLEAVTSIRIDRGLGLPGRARLVFIDTGFALSSSSTFALGTEVKISAGRDVLMEGEVTGVSLEQSGSGANLAVTVDDKAHRLAGATNNRVFLNQSLSDIVSKAVRESGLTVGTVNATGEVLPYWLQTGNDVDLVNQVCARAGLVWWFDKDSKFHAKTTAAHRGRTSKVTLGVELLAFSVRANTTGPDSVTVRGWNPAQQQVIVEKVATKVTAESDFVRKASGRASLPNGRTRAMALATSAPSTAAEAKAYAGGVLAQATSSSVVATGNVLGAGDLDLMDTVQVENAGPASGSYTISRLEHTYDHDNGFRTRFTAGPLRPSGLVDLLGGPGPGAGSDLSGVFAAVVSDVKDPDNQGRIKVSWKVVNDLVESAWARLVTLGAGDQRGMVFYPEVNDEVLIAFEHRDTRRPVILGGLFSPKNQLPSADNIDQGKVKYRRITSRLGHVIELADGDAPADQHILLELKGKKHRIRVGADEIEVVADKKPVKLTNGAASITMKENGDVTIEGNNVEIKGKQGVKVTGGTEVALKSSAVASLEGAQVKVHASGLADLKADGPMMVKGAIVMIN